VGASRAGLVGASALLLALWAGVALARVGYPFDLEWLEGALVDGVHQVMEGRGLYRRPTMAFTAFTYGPVYFYLAAVVAMVLGPGLATLRLLSILASVASLVLVYRFVARESGDGWAAWGAVGLLAATFRLSGGWFDLARVDSLLVALLLAGAYLVRFGRGPGSAVTAALLLTTAVLVKVTALVVLPFLVLYGLLRDRRTGAVLGLTLLAGLVAAVAAAQWVTGGWFAFYVVRVPMLRGLSVDPALGPFWWGDVIRPLPIASALAVAALLRLAGPPRADRLFYGLLGLGVLAAAWWTRLDAGSFANVLMPLHAGLALTFGVALAAGPGAWRAAALPGLAALQLLALGYHPTRHVPSSAALEAGRRLVSCLAAVPGPVLVLHHGNLASQAGKARHAHGLAIEDVVRTGRSEVVAPLVKEIGEAVAEARFEAIVLDHPVAWLQPGLEAAYGRPLAVLDDAAALRPVTGLPAYPTLAYRPRAAGDHEGPRTLCPR
jgi:4-amino-4-deoxy-L-arabinose transferase-like glycosyltransferase